MAATVLTPIINYVDSTVAYATTPADYIALDLTNDYLIWTAGDTVVKDLMTHEPTAGELNAAASVIDTVDVLVALCLLMDYSHNVGGAYYTHKVLGMSENKAYVFGFSFDGATATIPQLEAWDDSGHTTQAKHVLGANTPANSFIKAVKTTGGTLPGAGWVGTAIAGAANVLALDTAALVAAKDLYANIKIVIPASYATPAAETFVLTVRYTYA
jgi:hypothetical protein